MPELYNGVRSSNSGYVSQFVGSNADAMKEVADTLDKRYRENKDFADKLAINMANDEYMAADQHIGTRLNGELAGVVDQVASSPENFENSSGIIGNVARKYFTDRGRIAALKNTQKYNEYLDLKSKMGEKGEDLTSPFKGTLNADGSINKFQHNLQEKIDHHKQYETYFDDVAADLIKSGYTQDQVEQEFLKSTTEGGISTTKIGRIAADAFDKIHKDTGSYAQQKAVLKRDHPGMSDTDIDAHIYKGIVATGLERVHRRNDVDLQRHSEAYLHKLYNKDTPQDPITDGAPSGVVSNGVLKPIRKTSEDSTRGGKFFVQKVDNKDQAYEVFKNGVKVDKIDKVTEDKIRGENERTRAGLNNLGQGMFGNKDFKPEYELRPVDLEKEQSEGDKLYEKQKNLIGPDGKKLYRDKEHFLESHDMAAKNSEQTTAQGYKLGSEQRGIYSDDIDSDPSIPIFVPGQGDPLTKESLAKQYGVNPADIKLTASKVFDESPDAKLPGGYIEAKLEIKGEKIKDYPTTVRVPLGATAQAKSENIDHIYKNSLYQGQDTYDSPEKTFTPRTPSGQPMTYNGNPVALWTETRVIPAEKQQSGKHGYETIVHKGFKTDDGNFVEQGVMSISDYKESMRNAMHKMTKSVSNSGQTANDLDLKHTGITR